MTVNLGLKDLPTDKIETASSALDTDLIPIFTNKQSRPKFISVSLLNAGGILDDANEFTGDNTFTGELNAGKSGSAGDFNVFPPTASKGKFAVTVQDQTGDTVVTLDIDEHGQATVVNLPDAGASVTNLVQSTLPLTLAEADVLDGATVTTVELNTLDDSGQVETIDSGVAVSTIKFNTIIDNTPTGAGAITLATCPASMVGKIKTIRMGVDAGDVTLALTNIQGGTAATTATFDAVTEELILIGSAGGKWTVIKEFGVTLS